MAVSIKGKQILWGIPSAAKTVSDSLVEGIVDEVKISTGGNKALIPDEDGDIVTRVDHGAQNMVSVTARVTDATPELPAKGEEVTFAAAIDGVALNTGRAFVETAEITHKGVDATTVVITIEHYPSMAADA